LLEIRQFDGATEHVVDGRRLASRGQIFAFIIAMSGVGSGVYLARIGATVPASIIGGGGLITVILAFLNSGKQHGQQPPRKQG